MCLAIGTHRRLLLVVLSILLGGASWGQAQPIPDSTAGDSLHLDARLETVLDAYEEPGRREALAAERLADLAGRPLNLNRATAADLSVLPGLTSTMAHRIVEHRETRGPYEDWADLEDVAGLSAQTTRTVRSFLRLGPPPDSAGFPAIGTIVSNLDFSWIQRYTRDLDLSRGHRENRFVGPPGRLTSRLRLDHERRVQLAITLDKDPGEPLRWAPDTNTYGFDHVVGSLALRDLGPLETLVIGDFTAQFGQGVALWQGLRFGKGRDPVSPTLQDGRGVLPYRSASEANFFRGGAATLALPGGFSATAFVSRRNRDATLDSALVDGGGVATPLPVRTLSTGGSHRTPREIARKGTFGETTVGGALEHRSSTLTVGATGYYSRFDRALRPGDEPYRRYRVAGRRASMVSTYATAYLNDYTLFGEVARAPSGAYGGIVGAALETGEIAEAVVLGRRYPPDLSNFYGNAFGDGSRPQNEIGIYTGLRLQIAPQWSVAAYFDQYRAPWLRFNVPRPSSGWEARGILEYAPRPWLSTSLQARAQGQEAGTEHEGPGGRVLDGLYEERRYSARWHTEYAFSDELSVRTRLEISRYTDPSTNAEGVLLSQGLRWTPHPSLQVDARLAFFDTDGFDARIYSYEHDLLYSFSVPAFFDRGRRTYLLARYRPHPTLTLEAKYGATQYENRRSIGSGVNQVDGSRRREVGLQVRWSL